MTNPIAQRVAFAEALVELAQRDSRVLCLDGDLATSTRADVLADQRPDSFLEMGIAEQNLFGVAAGLSTLGFIPFISTFACFTKRALDQIRITIAQPRTNVKFTGAYSGLLTGKTGKTHQAVEDIAVFRAMPNMVTIVPVDGIEVRQAMHALVEYDGPVYLRLTRDPCPVVTAELAPFVIGQARVLREGKDIALICTGEMSSRCLEAAHALAQEGINAHILHVPTIKPLDEDAILDAAVRTGLVLTVEDHSIIGGLGGAVAEVLGERHPTRLKRLGWCDTYGESAPNELLLEKYGFTPKHIAAQARKLLELKVA